MTTDPDRRGWGVVPGWDHSALSPPSGDGREREQETMGIKTSDPEVQELVQTLISRFGTRVAAARYIGISEVTLRHYVNGSTARIPELTYMAMEQALKEAPLPTGPLREEIKKAASKTWQSIEDRQSDWWDAKNRSAGGMHLLLQHYASRFAYSERTAQRHHTAIFKEPVVAIEIADQWCAFLGIHPMALWPEEWPLEVDA